MLIGGKARKYWKVGEIHEKFEFVVIFTRYENKWVYCWHKKRESFEHPGGHVEENESPLQAAKRELYEGTGITDCDIIPLWDYEYIWEDNKGRNNGKEAESKC